MPTSASSSASFKHPGTFMSPDMTLYLKEEASRDPMRQQALQKLMKETPLTWRPRALEIVDIGFGGKGVGHAECTRDGEIAVSAALIYWATRDVRYAQLALDIMRAWAATNRVWKGDNGLLEATWAVCSMARAAELLKYALDESIRTAWTKIEPSFYKWLDGVIAPVLKSEHIWTWKPIGNWHFSQICARMQIAILREDKNDWAWCVARYPEALNKALIFAKCAGECSETCRDVTHAQFQLGGMAQAAEMALHQGVDLYDNRLVTCFELQAAIMMKEIPVGLSKEDIKTPYGYWYEPIWHIAYAHFFKRRNMPMPKTAAYLQQLGADRVCFHWGGNCLTHGHVKK